MNDNFKIDRIRFDINTENILYPLISVKKEILAMVKYMVLSTDFDLILFSFRDHQIHFGNHFR